MTTTSSSCLHANRMRQLLQRRRLRAGIRGIPFRGLWRPRSCLIPESRRNMSCAVLEGSPGSRTRCYIQQFGMPLRPGKLGRRWAARPYRRRKNCRRGDNATDGVTTLDEIQSSQLLGARCSPSRFAKPRSAGVGADVLGHPHFDKPTGVQLHPL